MFATRTYSSDKIWVTRWVSFTSSYPVLLLGPYRTWLTWTSIYRCISGCLLVPARNRPLSAGPPCEVSKMWVHDWRGHHLIRALLGNFWSELSAGLCHSHLCCIFFVYFHITNSLVYHNGNMVLSTTYTPSNPRSTGIVNGIVLCGL